MPENSTIQEADGRDARSHGTGIGVSAFAKLDGYLLSVEIVVCSSDPWRYTWPVPRSQFTYPDSA